VVKEKAFLISQVLDEAKVEASTSGLGLDGFKKLIREVKKTQDDGESGKKKKKKRERKKRGNVKNVLKTTPQIISPAFVDR
jgi:BRCT domain type II-containing protein